LIRISAVRYLNTAPLVWGLLHGPQQGLFDLRFELPAECADSVAEGRADLGLVPSAEIARLGLERVPGLGIASRGAVRSILLVAKKPLRELRRVAMDSSSRTSVGLARIILAERYGVRPATVSAAPDVQSMLRDSDAALVIGDPALLLEPGPDVHDLGSEWTELTGLPMVYAMWAGPAAGESGVREALEASWHFGRERVGEIVAEEAPKRGIPEALAREYLERNIVHEIGAREEEGLARYWELCGGLV
jgi:predicted solute-binding protein